MNNDHQSERRLADLLGDCDALFELGEIDDLVGKLRLLCQKWPMSAELAWRLSRALLIKSSKMTDQNARRVMLNDAFETASFGMRLNPSCWQTHHCYAVSLWDLKTTQSLGSLLDAAPVVRDHLERSLQLHPYPTTLHHLGLWHYRFARFPPYQRHLATFLFGHFPEADFACALVLFERAEQLAPGFDMRNRLMIAKCHQHLGDFDEAKRHLRMIKECESVDLDLTVYNEALERLLML